MKQMVLKWLSVSFLFLIQMSLFAQYENWANYTNTSEPISFVIQDSYVWGSF